VALRPPEIFWFPEKSIPLFVTSLRTGGAETEHLSRGRELALLGQAPRDDAAPRRRVCGRGICRQPGGRGRSIRGGAAGTNVTCESIPPHTKCLGRRLYLGRRLAWKLLPLAGRPRPEHPRRGNRYTCDIRIYSPPHQLFKGRLYLGRRLADGFAVEASVANRVAAGASEEGQQITIEQMNRVIGALCA